MKKLTFILLLAVSIKTFAESSEFTNKTCNAKISLGQTVIDPITRERYRELMTDDWFVDATGNRPTGFLTNGLAKAKYDGVRSILDKGYKLKVSTDETLDSTTTQPDDLLIVMRMVCSGDNASAFCGGSVAVIKAYETPNGIQSHSFVYQKLPEVTEASPEKLIYKTMKSLSKYLPKCIIK